MRLGNPRQCSITVPLTLHLRNHTVGDILPPVISYLHGPITYDKRKYAGDHSYSSSYNYRPEHFATQTFPRQRRERVSMMQLPLPRCFIV